MRPSLFVCIVVASSPITTTVRAEAPPDGPPPAWSVSASEEPTGTIELAAAVAAALRASPGLAAAAAEVRVRSARRLQAGLLPNPELFVEVENVGGSGARRNFDAAETTYGVSQRIELGGKRPKRRRLATLDRDLAGWDERERRLDVVTRTSLAFVATLVAQRRSALTRELAAVAERSVRQAEAQHRAGAAPAVEIKRATLALSRAEVEVVRAERALAADRATLAATWGGSPIFTEARGDLDSVASPPALAELERRLGDNPTLARWETELERRRAAVDVARAEAVPDPRIGLGGRHFSADDGDAVVFEVSVPLPFFDRNQGRVMAATAAAERARSERTAEARRLRVALAEQREALAGAYEEVRLLEEQTLPAARATFEDASRAWERGVLQALDVLDAQRTLFAVREQHLDTLARYHRARLQIERLTAAGIEP